MLSGFIIFFLVTNFSFPFFPCQNLTVWCPYIPALSTPATCIEPHIGRLTQGGSYSGQFIHGAGGRKAIAWCVTLTCSGVRQLETPTCEYVCGKASFTKAHSLCKHCLQNLHFLKKGSFSPNRPKLARADITCNFMQTRSLCRTVYSMNGLYMFLDKETLCILGLECIFVEVSFRHTFTRPFHP